MQKIHYTILKKHIKKAHKNSRLIFENCFRLKGKMYKKHLLTKSGMQVLFVELLQRTSQNINPRKTFLFANQVNEITSIVK